MAKQTIYTGAAANDKTGDQLRTAFTKVNDNFTELYATTDAHSAILAQAIAIATLKSVVAASADFDDFKARIAAL
jgi:hypothetical protein